jgi:hypothetical protein
VILWTIQSVAAWSRLQKDGVLRADGRRIRRRYRWAYEWLARQMSERIGCRPSEKTLPLWAWSQWNGAKCRKPDLRSSGYLPPGDRGVRIEFEISDRLVLLSDFDLWHYALNCWYLPESQQDDEEFKSELSRRGMSFYKEKPLRDAELHKRIPESWIRIFDMDWADTDQSIARPRAKKSIQASFRELRAEQVRHAQLFTAR